MTSLINFAYAATASTLQNPINVNSLGQAIDKAVSIFAYIAVIVGVLAFIVVGLQFILAQGKPDKLKEAGLRLWYIVIGVAIVLGARLIVSVVLNTLDSTKLVNEKIINSAQNALNGQNVPK